MTPIERAQNRAQVLGIDSVIDACVFHEWKSSGDLLPYLSRGWRDLVLPPGSGLSPLPLWTGRWYENPTGEKANSAYPSEGPPGSDFELLIRHMFETGRRARIVLAYDQGFYVTAFGQVQAAMTFVRAINDWNIEHWLSRDDRLFGLALVTSQVPDEAAAEIRRIGRNHKIVGIAIGANGIGRMYGHPVYHPIFRAAAELQLPIVIQVGTESGSTSILPPVGGGMPATYSEYRAMRMHGVMSHVASMITQGVFRLFPDLKVLLVGPGTLWIPSYLWRLNYFYKRHHEMPWLDNPSDLFKRHVRIATSSLESPRRVTDLATVLGTVPWIGSTLLYASGYPNFDFEEPEQQAGRLPEDWHEGVFRQNALDFFRWPDSSVGPSSETKLAAVGANG